jgi:retinol dehydrogenase-12
MPALQDQIILVTGATSGIGEVTARELARQGAHIVLLARNQAKAEKTQAAIKAAAGHDRVDIVLADLADLAQVRTAAAEISNRYPHLDVLVNNAGLMFGSQRETSADGFEMTLATNHLGPFLLTSLLFDLLRKSPAARIVNVASEAHKFAKPDLHDLNAEHNYSATRMYGNTKLYNIMFTQELARRLRAQGISNITTNCLHPGFVATGFGSQSGGILTLLTQLLRPVMISKEQGAETSIYLASSPAIKEISGGYFEKKQAKAVKHPFNTLENAQNLWQETERMVEQEFPLS